MKKMLLGLAILIASLSTVACSGALNRETAVALAEKHVEGRAVYTSTEAYGTRTILVCTETSVVPVVVSGSASNPKVQGFRTEKIATCGRPEVLWRKYNEALTNWKAEKAKAAMAALEEAIK